MPNRLGVTGTLAVPNSTFTHSSIVSLLFYFILFTNVGLLFYFMTIIYALLVLLVAMLVTTITTLYDLTI